MAATHDSAINVLVRLGAPGVVPAGFGRVAVLVDVTGNLTTNPTLFTTTTAIDADSDLSDPQKEQVKNVLTQLQPAEDVIVASYDSGASETPVTAFEALIADGRDFYPVVMNSRTATEQVALSDEIQSKGNAGEKVAFYLLETDEKALTGSGEPFETIADNNRTFFIHHTLTDDDYADAAAAGYRFSYDLDQQSPQIRGQLSGVEADTLTANERSNLEAENVNLVLPYGPVGAFLSPGVMADGTPATDIIAADWLAARLRERLLQLDLDTTARGDVIPLDSTGQALVAAELADVFELAITNGKLSSFEITEPFPPITTSDVAALRLPLNATAVTRVGAVAFAFTVDLS